MARKINDEYDIGKAFQAIEEELMASMVRNMKRHRAWEDAEGMHWEQWQALQLKSLEKYKKDNQKRFKGQFKDINREIESLIYAAHKQGGMDQEKAILRAIKKGFPAKKVSSGATAEFFKINDRKLDALIHATTNDMQKAETAVLRMANDKYRKVIFNAQVYANTGAGTYEKAVDMATKDMLSAGLNCVEYANGARHTLSDYADMAIRTASKRAYLQGEGQKRQEWGLHLVIMNKRGNPCPKCLPFVGKVLIDDVWSGGSKSDGDYPLMSAAISAGLYHPRCKDGHTTYFPGISTPPDDKFSKRELAEVEEQSRLEARQQYAARQKAKYSRLARFSLDGDNQEDYKRKEKIWSQQIAELTQDEKGAIIRYVSPDSYVLNDKLRRHEALTESEKDWIMKLDKALEKLPYYEGDLNRSLIFVHDIEAKNVYDKMKIGEEYIPSQYLSATKEGFYDEAAKVQIYIQNAKKAKDLGDMNDMEKEVLYPVMSKFKVLNKVKQDDKYYILLEEVD